MPTDWQNAIIILLHKKGDQKDLGNYRPISLLPIINKLFTKVITSRIAEKLDIQQPREQAGFRKRIFNNLTTFIPLINLLKNPVNTTFPLWFAFVDYRKAFDSVEITTVISALEKQEIKPIYVNMIKNIYKNCTSVIKLHKDSEPLPTTKRSKTGRHHFAKAFYCMP